MRGARPAGPPPRPSAEPVTVQRRASNTGIIMVAGQKIALGRIHAGHVIAGHVAAETVTVTSARIPAPSGAPPSRFAASRPTVRTSAAQELPRPAMRS